MRLRPGADARGALQAAVRAGARLRLNARGALGPLLLIAGAIATSACSKADYGACFEPNATPYAFSAPGDSALIFHWPNSYMPVRVYAEPVGALPTNVANGLSLWESAFRCGELVAQSWPDSATADIVVRNPAALPPPTIAGASFMAGDSTQACTGRTDVDTTSATVVQRPIRSYVAPLGADTAATSACYHFVTAHELGHALGLLSHSTDPNDLMYVSPKHTLLSADDRYTIQLLYHLTPTAFPTFR